MRTALYKATALAVTFSLAGVLGTLGRYDEAWAELTRAIELEPLNVEAYHNRAVISERRVSVEIVNTEASSAAIGNPSSD